MTDAKQGFANLHSNQVKHQEYEKKLADLTQKRSHLHQLFIASLKSAVKDWQNSIKQYLTSNQVNETALNSYQLDDVTINVIWPDFKQYASNSYYFEIKIRFPNVKNVQNFSWVKYTYSISIPHFLGSTIPTTHNPNTLDNEVVKISEEIKNYKNPEFTFDIKYHLDNQPNARPIAIQQKVSNIEDCNEIIFADFFKKYESYR